MSIMLTMTFLISMIQGGQKGPHQEELPLRKPKRRLELYLRMDKVSAFTTNTVDEDDDEDLEDTASGTGKADKDATEGPDLLGGQSGGEKSPSQSDFNEPPKQGAEGWGTQEDRVCWKRLDYTYQSNSNINGNGDDIAALQKDRRTRVHSRVYV